MTESVSHAGAADVAVVPDSPEQPSCKVVSESNISTSTVWEDLDVLTLKPAKQIVMDKTKSCDPMLASMAAEIEDRCQKGPNLKYSFAILFTAAVSIAMICYSSNVRESLWLFRILWLLAFAINIITVSIPGRLDRVLVDGNHIKPWSSLFELSTWAFAIWGVIYLSEIFLSGYVVLIGIPVKLFQSLVPYWLAGNWFQGLWCFSFRPEFKSALWVPTIFLFLGAFTFFKAHVEITSYITTNQLEGVAKYCIMALRVPFAIHASWLAAAALVNLNSFVAISNFSKGMQISVAHGSAYVAALYGLYGALTTGDATIPITIAWALEAAATRTHEKIKLPGNIVGSDIQESLSITESFLGNAMKCAALGMIVSPFVAHH